MKKKSARNPKNSEKKLKYSDPKPNRNFPEKQKRTLFLKKIKKHDLNFFL
jgi:hypothetical protein